MQGGLVRQTNPRCKGAAAHLGPRFLGLRRACIRRGAGLSHRARAAL